MSPHSKALQVKTFLSVVGVLNKQFGQIMANTAPLVKCEIHFISDEYPVILLSKSYYCEAAKSGNAGFSPVVKRLLQLKVNMTK